MLRITVHEKPGALTFRLEKEGQPCTSFLSTPSRLTCGAGRSGAVVRCSAAAPPRPGATPKWPCAMASTPEARGFARREGRSGARRTREGIPMAETIEKSLLDPDFASLT